MKDGASWEDAADTGETYDLIVVGGGISGLAAAHFFRKSVGAKARILVLDNHDDFGGHAKRNEFTSSNGRFLIGYGGSQSIDTPSGFSHETKELFEELGIELERFHGAFDDELYSSLGLSRGTFFDRESFGTDRLVVRRDLSWEDFAALMPLDPETQRDLVRLDEEPKDYLAELAPDDESSAVRIRLESTVVRAESDRDGVNVTYLRGGQASRVRGRYAVLACWNSLIPYLCPELPEEQKKALSYAVKVPLNYTNVQIRNWQSFAELGISRVSCPGSYWAGVGLDFPVALGDYVNPRTPDEPMVLHLSRSYTSPGKPPKEQFQTGRYEMLSTSFEDFERNIRDQLERILSPGGFDPARDIEAITVNRWPHGYAYEYAYLGEPEWTDENKPCVLGRKPFGRMAIANSDAGGEAYADCAIDQAHRAVQELVALAD